MANNTGYGRVQWPTILYMVGSMCQQYIWYRVHGPTGAMGRYGRIHVLTVLGMEGSTVIVTCKHIDETEDSAEHHVAEGGPLPSEVLDREDGGDVGGDLHGAGDEESEVVAYTQIRRAKGQAVVHHRIDEPTKYESDRICYHAKQIEI